MKTKLRTSKAKAERINAILSDLKPSNRLKTPADNQNAPSDVRRVSRGMEKPDSNSAETHSPVFPQADPIRQTMCDGKIRYDDKRNALTKINTLRDRRGVQLRRYACPYCNGWHLTKKF